MATETSNVLQFPSRVDSATAVEPPTVFTRDEAIRRIRTALKARSGKTWSVTGGRGTGYGWITIDAPPARRTANFDGGPRTSDFHGYMTLEDRAELARLLSVENVYAQGINIPASHDYRREYVDRAEGRTPSVIGEPYWD